MSNYTLDYSGPQINQRLDQLDALQTRVTAIETDASQRIPCTYISTSDNNLLFAANAASLQLTTPIISPSYTTDSLVYASHDENMFNLNRRLGTITRISNSYKYGWTQVDEICGTNACGVLINTDTQIFHGEDLVAGTWVGDQTIPNATGNYSENVYISQASLNRLIWVSEPMLKMKANTTITLHLPEGVSLQRFVMYYLSDNDEGYSTFQDDTFQQHDHILVDPDYHSDTSDFYHGHDRDVVFTTKYNNACIIMAFSEPGVDYGEVNEYNTAFRTLIENNVTVTLHDNDAAPAMATYTDTTIAGLINAINGVEYESLNASSNGSDVSLVTTGEKYNWNNKADINSPVFTGTPTAPTAATTANNTQIATTAFVKSALNDITNNLPLATSSTNGLMSASDKQVLDHMNPNVAIELSNLFLEKVYLNNAKQDNLIELLYVAEPKIATQTRTINMLNVNADLEAAYITGTGVYTSSTGTDLLGPYIEVTPGQDIYYTGITNPGAGATQKFNRRLHAFDSNHHWVQQISYVQVTGPNAPWSTHGTIPNDVAYVRVAWNEGDYNIMVTEGAPSKYYPYYITPFSPYETTTLYISPDDTLANANEYTFTVPQEAGDLYSFIVNPIEGTILASTAHIASYNGETLPNVWWSDRDTYVEGTTPSIGAEVVYVLASGSEFVGTTYNITPTTIPLFYRHNYIWADNGTIANLKYNAETLSASHFTVGDGGVLFGETPIIETDIIKWNTIDDKADIDSPTFTGSPEAPNPGSSSNSTRIATTSFVQHLFEKNIATLTSNSASQNFAVGDYLIYNGQLYKVTAPITSGQSLSIGTNIEAITINDELKILKIKKYSIFLTTSWSGNGPYTQTVTISNATITENSKVDLQPDATTITQLAADGVKALYINNNAGTLTAYAIGAAPTATLTIQCTITEVDV